MANENKQTLTGQQLLPLLLKLLPGATQMAGMFSKQGEAQAGTTETEPPTMTEVFEKDLNPMQESDWKVVKGIRKKQMEEAAQSGVPTEQLLDQAGLTQAITNGFKREGGFLHRPMQVEQETGKVHPEEILGGLIKAHPDTTAQMLANILKGQEITGQKPLQKGEKEKIKLEGAQAIAKELAKAGSVDALTPENAGKFQLLTEGYESTLAIDDLLGNNVTAALFAQGVPNFLKSQNAKLLESAIERAVQGRTRIETGAALQPSELKSTSKRFMPKKGDTIDTALRRLKPLYDYFYGAMNIADPTGVHRQRAKGMDAQQISAKITSFKEVK